jgi:predicted helicase
VQKLSFLEETERVGNVTWQAIEPNEKQDWLTGELRSDFEDLLPVGNKLTKGSDTSSAIFENYSRGAETTRDAWLYNFNEERLIGNIGLFIETYNEQVYKWHKQRKRSGTIDSFVSYDERKIKWSRSLKNFLAANVSATLKLENVRRSIYRPFTVEYLYFDQILTHRRGQLPHIFPTSSSEIENRAIAITGHSQTPFVAQIVAFIPCLDVGGRPSQCFPFYTYNEDGTNRRENITEWALEQFRAHYKDKSITKWDIFHYVYAVLHHQLYRERYAANLKRELPRIPFAPDFRAFADIGKRLAEIHVNYEQQTEYPLERIEKPGAQLDWRVERMKLSKDKRSLIYNDFLTLSGIPPEVFEYRLGNRSALEWIIDQYQVSTDKRSGITNDPNPPDDPQYIVNLIGQVITVSVETVSLVKTLAGLPVVADIA